MPQYVFPKVDLPKVGSTNMDLSRDYFLSFAPCVAVPVLAEDVLPGDHFYDVNVDALVESFPMLAPTFGKWKANFDWFFEPASNLYGFMDNNTRMSTEEIIKSNLHTLRLSFLPVNGVDSGDLSAFAVKPSSLMNYLGVPAGYCGYRDDDGSPAEMMNMSNDILCADYFLTYLDICRNFYVNNQENYIQFVSDVDNDDEGATLVSRIPLGDLDNCFRDLRACVDGIDIIDGSQYPYDTESWRTFNEIIRYSANINGGLVCRSYRMDLNRGLLNRDIGTFKSTVKINNGEFSIETLRYANKLQKLIDKLDLSGGRFSDWIRTVWSVKPRKHLDIPEYLGSFSQIIHMSDIVSPTAGTNDNKAVPEESRYSSPGQQFGFLAGRANRGRSIKFKSDEYGTLMCIFSLVPYVSYSQGFEISRLKTKWADRFTPDMAQLGWQDVSMKELYALPVYGHRTPSDPNNTEPNTEDYNEVVGKKVAWSEYMGGLNRTFGLFAYGQSLDYWALGRSYITVNTAEDLSEVFDSTTYMRPDLFNYAFTDVKASANNFRLKCHFNIQVRRPIPKRTMPKL